MHSSLVDSYRSVGHRMGPLALLVMLSLTVSRPVLAQTSPGDLMDLSLAELLQREILPPEGLHDAERWHFDYRYVRGQFGGYRDGTTPVEDANLLGPPNNVTYPILQTRIVQEVHLVRVAYNFSRRFSTNVVVPYVRQSTDHISVVPSYESFTITSDGVGDVSLSLTSLIYAAGKDSLTIHVAISVPNGSITETGNTPAGPGSQLPYTMQIGSGTWDVPIGLTFVRTTDGAAGLGPVRYRLSATGKVRTGENSRGYRLGHRLVVDGVVSLQPLTWLSPSLGASSEVWGDVKGHDLNFPGPIYPTPVANPELFGGQRVSAVFALAFGDAGSSLGINFSVPVYQNLHGPQPEEDWRGTVTWDLSF